MRRNARRLCSALLVLLLMGSLLPADAAGELHCEIHVDKNHLTGGLPVVFTYDIRGGTPPYQVRKSLGGRYHGDADELMTPFEPVTTQGGPESIVMPLQMPEFGWVNIEVRDAAGKVEVFQSDYFDPIEPIVPAARPADGAVELTWRYGPFNMREVRIHAYENGSYQLLATDEECYLVDPEGPDYGYTVRGLTNGKQYTFIVQASTYSGWSTLNEQFHVTATPVASPPDTQGLRAEITVSPGTVASGERVQVSFHITGGKSPYSYQYQHPLDLANQQEGKGDRGAFSFSVAPGMHSMPEMTIWITDEGTGEQIMTSATIPLTISDGWPGGRMRVQFDKDSVKRGKPITATLQLPYIPDLGGYATGFVTWAITDEKGKLTRSKPHKTKDIFGSSYEKTFTFTPKKGVSGVLEVNFETAAGDGSYDTELSQPFSIHK